MISLANKSPELGPEDGTSNLIERNGLNERAVQSVKQWPIGFNQLGMEAVALGRKGVGASQRTLITKMRNSVAGILRLPNTGANLRSARPLDVVSSGKMTKGRRIFRASSGKEKYS